ncbi:MAG: helix-turn-helix domain-containing protein, partial [Methylocystis sp.]
VSSRRSRPSVARARQLAVYLHHVALGASLSACARTFARDRATVRHACATIEDLRDDPRFDAAARRLESALVAQRDMVCALLAQGNVAQGSAR